MKSKTFMMSTKFCFTICLSLVFASVVFSQEPETRKVFSILNSETDIIKEEKFNTVNATLSYFSDSEIDFFRERMSTGSGVHQVSVTLQHPTFFKCVIVLNKDVKKRSLIKILQAAGVENVAIDDVNCKISDYVKIMEEKKRGKAE